jgi:hypothetical protein
MPAMRARVLMPVGSLSVAYRVSSGAVLVYSGCR